MPVGDVGAGHAAEHELEGLDGLRAPHAPYGLADALAVGEVVERLRGARARHEEREGGLVSVGEEDGPGLAAGRLDVADAVVLLVAARELVALDGAVHVIVERAGRDDARLGTPALLEPIEVVALVGVAHEGAVGGALLEDAAGGGVDVVGVHVVVGPEGGLRAVDGQEARGVVGDEGRGLVAVEDVVGQRGELRGAVGVGAQAGERLGVHRDSSVWLGRFMSRRASRPGGLPPGVSSP